MSADASMLADLVVKFGSTHTITIEKDVITISPMNIEKKDGTDPIICHHCKKHILLHDHVFCGGCGGDRGPEKLSYCHHCVTPASKYIFGRGDVLCGNCGRTRV